MSVSRFSTCWVESGVWLVVDQTRNAVARCTGANCAGLIAGLMNGDLTELALADAETLAQCHSKIVKVLGASRPRGRPALGSAAFPQL
jgi:hypothetical protein